LASGIGAERVDFIAVPTRDLARAQKFYGETLGVERNPMSTDTWVEYETGNVTLALVRPEQIGIPFNPLPSGPTSRRHGRSSRNRPSSSR